MLCELFMLLTQINDGLKQAMRDKDEIVLSALRNLKAEITNSELEKKTELSEEEILKVVAKKVKQHKDSIESFKSGGRNDLVEHEQQQMAVLAKFLPAQLSEDEVRAVVKDVISELQAKPSDFGKVMKEVLAKAQGQTDGTVVSKIVKEELK